MQWFGPVWCNNFFKKKRKKVKKRKENRAVAARDKMQGCPVNTGIPLISTVQWGTCTVLAFFPSWGLWEGRLTLVFFFGFFELLNVLT